MQAVILVGGAGTRLRPLTDSTPKPMVPVLNRPFLEYTLARLRRHGVTDVVLAMHYLWDKVRDHFGDGSAFGLRLTYTIEPEPRGTAGAVKCALPHLTGSCFVLNGDVYMDLDLRAMAAAHRQNKALVTIALTTVEDTSRYGVVETTASGRVQRFLEKPAPGVTSARTINAGCYILEPQALDSVPADKYYMFERDLFPDLLRRGMPVYGYTSDGYWIDIGTPRHYLDLHRALLRGPELDPEPHGTAHAGRVWIGPGCRIDPSAQITGPLVIGRDCVIGARAVLEGPLTLGEGCSVGPDALLRDAVVWDRVNIGAGAHIAECLVGSNTTIAAGESLPPGQVLGGNGAPDTNAASTDTVPEIPQRRRTRGRAP